MSWFEDQKKDPEFRKLYDHEEFVEDFLMAVEGAMVETGITKDELARSLAMSPAVFRRILDRTYGLTTKRMSEIAFHLGRKLSVKLD